MTIALKSDASGTFGEILVNGTQVAKFTPSGAAVIPGAVGTVSQSGGIPTGAIIESGSNANGEYVRFADGTQICYHFVSTSSSNGVIWTYPAEFTGGTVPRMAGTNQGTVAQTLMTDLTPTNVSATLSSYTTSNARVATIVRLIAIGRWF